MLHHATAGGGHAWNEYHYLKRFVTFLTAPLFPYLFFALINKFMICNCQRAGRYHHDIDLASLSGGNRSPVCEM